MAREELHKGFLLYNTPDGKVRIEVALEDEIVWLTQKAMAELFGIEVQTINYHLKEVFKSGELVEDSVIRKNRITAIDGKKYLTNFYNLDAIISVGYRVNSIQAAQFRKWVTKTLREYLIKGFVLDDERLKQGRLFLGRITSMNFWNSFGKSGSRSGDYTKKLRTSMRNAALITIPIPKSPKPSTKPFRTNYIGQFPAILLLN